MPWYRRPSGRTLLLFAALLLGTIPTRAQLPQVLPIRSVGGLLVIDASIEGRPAPLLLDTGAWASMVDTTAVRELGLASRPVRPGATVNGMVRIGEFADSMPLFVRSSVYAGRGRPIVGILGADFFRRFVVRIDAAARTMTLLEPRSFTYEGSGWVVPFTVRRGMPIVAATITMGDGSARPARLLVDAGTARLPVVLSSRFARRDPIGSPAESLQVYGMSRTVRGSALSHARRLHSLTLGPVVVVQPFVVISPAMDDVLPDSVADGTLGWACWSGPSSMSTMRGAGSSWNPERDGESGTDRYRADVYRIAKATGIISPPASANFPERSSDTIPMLRSE